MRHRLYLHVVWTTLERAHSIDAARARYLDAELRVIAQQERAIVFAIGIVRTHVHVLLKTHPATDIPRMMQRFKGTTSYGLRHGNIGGTAPLRWSRSYAIHSVSEKALVVVADYVQHQAEQHPDQVIQGWQARRVELPVADAEGEADARRRD